MIIAVAVAEIFVASEGPFADKGAPAFGALVPITFAGSGAAHDELADLVIHGFASLFVDDFQVVARHRFSGGAVAHVIRPVGKERLEHFRRADAVEDIDAARRPPALTERARQGLSSGEAEPQPVGAGAARHI